VLLRLQRCSRKRVDRRNRRSGRNSEWWNESARSNQNLLMRLASIALQIERDRVSSCRCTAVRTQVRDTLRIGLFWLSLLCQAAIRALDRTRKACRKRGLSRPELGLLGHSKIHDALLEPLKKFLGITVDVCRCMVHCKVTIVAGALNDVQQSALLKSRLVATMKPTV